jgi:hypothetical protein
MANWDRFPTGLQFQSLLHLISAALFLGLVHRQEPVSCVHDFQFSNLAVSTICFNVENFFWRSELIGIKLQFFFLTTSLVVHKVYNIYLLLHGLQQIHRHFKSLCPLAAFQQVTIIATAHTTTSRPVHFVLLKRTGNALLCYFGIRF